MACWWICDRFFYLRNLLVCEWVFYLRNCGDIVELFCLRKKNVLKEIETKVRLGKMFSIYAKKMRSDLERIFVV